MWKQGITWVRGYLAETHNPDGTIKAIWVHSGPFFFLRFRFFTLYKKNMRKDFFLETYLGFRPTPTWSSGHGNEGDFGTGGLGRWMKKHGWGNLGAAFRVKREVI